MKSAVRKFKKLLCLLLACILLALPINTFASGFIKLPLSTSTNLNSPGGVALDSVGNIYVADSGDNRILKLDLNGNLISSWDNSNNPGGIFNNPGGVCLDSAGNMYVSDSGNNRIVKLAPSGNQTAVFNNSINAGGTFKNPGGIAVDDSGNIYVADSGNNRIVVLDSNGNQNAAWNNSNNSGGIFNSPGGVAVDTAGKIYVADSNNNRIVVLDSNGNQTTAWNNTYNSNIGLNRPKGIAVDNTGNIFTADTGNARIVKFDKTGNQVALWNGVDGLTITFRQPCGLALTGTGAVYVADKGMNNILYFDSPPAVVSSYPSSNAINVSTNSSITLTFDKPITMTPAIIYCINLSSLGTGMHCSENVNGNVLTITPEKGLRYGAPYTLHMEGGAVQDTLKTLMGSFNLSFTTAANDSAAISSPPVNQTPPADTASAPPASTTSTSGSGSSTTVTPATSSGSSVTIDNPQGPVTTVPATTNTDTSADISLKPYVVAAAEITEEAFANAAAIAVVNSEGIKTVNLKIDQSGSANAFILKMPASAMKSQNNIRVAIKTAIASATLPCNLLTGIATGDKVAVKIALVENSAIAGISTGTLTAVGNKPVVDISVMTGEGTGKISISDFKIPGSVSIPYTPTQDELTNFEHITILNINEKSAAAVPSGKYNPSTGEVTFNIKGFSRYAVAYVNKTFNDLSDVSWAKKQIEVLASKGIINGKTDQTYAPSESITRGDFIKLLVNTLGLTADFNLNFKDVNKSDYYYNEIGIANSLGISKGYNTAIFGAKDPITRQDMMVMTARALNIARKVPLTGSTYDLSKFTDSSSVSAYAIDGISTLYNKGIIKGSGSLINPLQKATRAEIAAMLYNIYNN